MKSRNGVRPQVASINSFWTTTPATWSAATSPRRSAAAAAAASVVLSAILAIALTGCETSPSIPPPPIAAPSQPLKELEGNPAATRPTDVNLVAARVRAHLAELEAAKAATPPAPEQPSLRDPAAPPLTPPPSNSPAAPSASNATPAPTEPTTPPALTPHAPPTNVNVAVAVTDSTATTPSPGVTTPARSTPSNPNPTTPAPSNLAPANVAPSRLAIDATPGTLEAEVAQRVARDPRDVSAVLDAQLLAYLKGQPSPDSSAIASLPLEDRELVSAMIDSLVNFRAGVRSDPNADYSTKVRPLAEMSDRLKTRADLTVPVLTAVSEVKAYGIYQPIPGALTSRVESQLRLYYEVANFTSRYNDKRLWETRLGQQITLYDNAGRVIWQDRMETWTDLCRNRRTDFYIAPILRIPGVPPGKYTLKLTITDLNVGRVTESTTLLESR